VWRLYLAFSSKSSDQPVNTLSHIYNSQQSILHATSTILLSLVTSSPSKHRVKAELNTVCVSLHPVHCIRLSHDEEEYAGHSPIR
jgi:hypothetical protein